MADFEQPVIDGESVRGYGATAFRQADTEFQEAYNAELQNEGVGRVAGNFAEVRVHRRRAPGEMTAAALRGIACRIRGLIFSLRAERGGDHDCSCFLFSHSCGRDVLRPGYADCRSCGSFAR